MAEFPSDPQKQVRGRQAINFVLILVLAVSWPGATLHGAAKGQAQGSDMELSGADRRETLAVKANRLLGLRESRITTIEPGPIAGHREVRIPIDDAVRRVRFSPHSVRSPGYQLSVYGPGGIAAAHEPSASRTVRGVVNGLEGAQMAGSMLDDGLHALILLADGRRIWIEPLPGDLPGRHIGDHVVYRDEDQLNQGVSCGAATPLAELAATTDAADATAITASGEPNDIHFARLAVDSDVEYFTALGSVANVEARINNIVNIVNVQYERDVRIYHVLTHLIVRTAEPDPYASLGASNLLDEFRNHWFQFLHTIERDVAHFFTGKSLFNGTAGIAYFTGLCSDTEGYSLASRPACWGLACETDLTAHELGHNWGAPHCACSGYTMNASVQGSNRFHPEFTVPKIVTYRDSRDCLEIGDDLEGLSIIAPATIAETNTVQLIAQASFRLHADRDVSPATVWAVEPPELGMVDASGVFSAAEVDGSASGVVSATYEFDGVLAEAMLPITVVDAFPAPVRDLSTPDKNRYLSMAVPPEAGDVAIFVKVIEMFRPDPPYALSVEVYDLSEFDGAVRWVGPPSICNERHGQPGQFVCAKLQCEPYYTDAWGSEVIHVTSGDIMPSSTFEVRTVPVECRDQEDNCSHYSAPLNLATQRWGDVVPSFQVPGGPPGSATQPNILDISAIVNKLVGLPAIAQSEAHLNSTAPDPDGGISVLEVSFIIDAMKGAAPINLYPCNCPSFAVCPSADTCGRCRP